MGRNSNISRKEYVLNEQPSVNLKNFVNFLLSCLTIVSNSKSVGL